MFESHGFREDLRRFGPKSESGGVDSGTATPPDAEHAPPTAEQAQAYCRSLTTRHYENFTVASWLLPRRYRQDVCNLYAYCRWSDDLADETGSPGESLALLFWWRSQLEDVFRGKARHPVFVALAETLSRHELPQQPFRDLLDAFERDQHQTRYATVGDLMSYCSGSANPVGRLYLHLTDQASSENLAFSDSICTGLQWANFCQDVARDQARGRIYLPRETWAACGYTDEDFAERRCNDAFRSLLRTEVDRADRFLRNGWPLVEGISSEIRVPIELFVRGGLAILQRIRDEGYDVWSRRTVLSRTAKLQLALAALGKAQLAAWQSRRASHRGPHER